MKYSNRRKYRDKEVFEEIKTVTKKRKKNLKFMDKIKNLFKTG